MMSNNPLDRLKHAFIFYEPSIVTSILRFTTHKIAIFTSISDFIIPFIIVFSEIVKTIWTDRSRNSCVDLVVGKSDTESLIPSILFSFSFVNSQRKANLVLYG